MGLQDVHCGHRHRFAGRVPVAGSSSLRKRSAQWALRLLRAGRAFFRLDFRALAQALDLDLDAARHRLRAKRCEQLAPAIQAAIMPGSYQQVHSGGRGAGRQTVRTRPPRGRRPRSPGSCGSVPASPGACLAARRASAPLRARRCAGPTPRRSPAAAHRAATRSRSPRASRADAVPTSWRLVWFLPMICSPSVCGRRAKFRSLPSWIASTVRCPRMRAMLRAAVRRQDVLHRHVGFRWVLDEPVETRPPPRCRCRDGH